MNELKQLPVEAKHGKSKTDWAYYARLAGMAAVASVSAFSFAYAPRITEKSLHAFESVRFRNWAIKNNEDQSHVSAVDAWKIEQGSHDVIVAVIDTGIDPNHPDIQPNLWRDPKNPKVYGWDFVKNEANPVDDHGHGTHVAGIIGAVLNPKTGTAGIAQKVSILPVRYYSDANPGPVNLRNTIRAIEYAVSKGAKIINYSGGGPEFSEEEYLAIKKAEAQGVFFVAAAGNEKQNTDLVQNYYYPSAYRLSNILSVAATDIHNQLLKSSNWGKVRVDVTAPGENIYSTLPMNKGKYGFMSGTSQATAVVTGLAALMLSKNPKLKPHELKRLIIATVDKFPQLESKVASSGRVNAYRALTALLPNSGNRVAAGFRAKPLPIGVR
jgi:thermitase